MTKILNSIKAIAVLLALILSFIACDKDYASIGVDVIGNNNFQTNSISYPVISFNNKVKPVQTNNLTSNLLGVYNDPVYGITSANLLSQLNLATGSQNRTYGVNIRLDSIVLTIPYFSGVDPDESTDENGNTNYVLDSVFGNPDTPLKLSIYKNNYFLRDYDPNTDFVQNQKYYSSGETSVGSSIAVSEMESELIYQSDSLFFDKSEIILTTNNYSDSEIEEEITSRLKPALRLKLDSLFWKENIIDKIGEPELSNTNNFKQYFRGLYFKVESNGLDSPMILLDISSSTTNVTLHFTSVDEFEDDDNDGIPNVADADMDGDGNLDEDVLDTDGDGIKDASDADVDGDGILEDDVLDINSDGIDDEVVAVKQNTIVLNLNGNRVNIFDNSQFDASILNEIENPNTIEGDEKLYLKGGQGSMAVIDLFGGPDSAEFLEFKSHQGEWLINEANLIFYEDETLITGEDHSNDRIFVYDVNNNLPLIDYFRDTQSTIDPFNSFINHLGKRYTDAQGNNKFKIRITEHINNILLKDSTNTKLGLTISTNVNSYDTSELLGVTESDNVEEIPTGTVLSPKGTVLHGNNSSVTNKKVKLEIYYTEPNN